LDEKGNACHHDKMKQEANNMSSPLCSVNMLEPITRVSFRFLGCFLVCRTVDPVGITLSLVCWAPMMLPADYCIMPVACRLSVRSRTVLRTRSQLATLARLHFRHSGAGGETNVVIIVLCVIWSARTTANRQCDRPSTRSADHSAAAEGLFTFLHVNYRSLAVSRHI